MRASSRHLKSVATGEERNWGPYEQIIFLFPPVAQGQFRLNKAIMSELVVLAGSAVLPIKYVVKCRTKIELGLKIVDCV